MFTTVQRLKRRHLPSKCTRHHGLTLYHKAIDTEPIKVVEFAYDEKVCSYLLPEASYDTMDYKQPLNFTNTTFVYFGAFHRCRRGTVPYAATEVDRLTRCPKWVSCAPIVPSNDLASYLPSVLFLDRSSDCPQALLPNPCDTLGKLESLSITETLTHLYIDNVTKLTDHNLPLLVMLTVVFPVSQDDDMLQEISNLEVPTLKNFVVHYKSSPPVLRKIHVPICQNVPGMFEMSFIGYTDVYGSDYAEKEASILERVTSLSDYEFMGQLDFVVLSGLPYQLVQKLNFSRTMSLDWTISRSDTFKEGISLPLIERLWITVTAEGIWLPQIVCPSLEKLYLTLLVDQCQIWPLMSSFGGLVHRLSVYKRCSPSSSLCSHSIMSDEEWYQWFENASLNRFDEIRFTGFEMPLLYHYKLPILRSRILEFSPVLTKHRLERAERLEVKGIEIDEFTEKLSFLPIFTDHSSVLVASQKDVCFDFGLTMPGQGFTLVCGTEFKSYALAGFDVIPMDLTQRWRQEMAKLFNSKAFETTGTWLNVVHNEWRVLVINSPGQSAPFLKRIKYSPLVEAPYVSAEKLFRLHGR